MMIRPAELKAIKAGEIDLAFRRWERPRVVVGTQMRTAVGLIEVTSLAAVPASKLTAAEARRAGAESLVALKANLAPRTGTIFRIGLTYAGADPRVALRESVPTSDEIAAIQLRLDRLDRSAPEPWTGISLDLIDEFPTVRAPELAAKVGRETADFKRDIRKLKELGLTESLDIGYRLSPRGEAVVDARLAKPRVRKPRPTGTALPRIGAPATRALRAQGIETLEAVTALSRTGLAALHGVGPIAINRLAEALAEAGLSFADD